MNIYKVEQNWNNGYDAYSNFICIAESEQAARETYPTEYVTHGRDGKWYGTNSKGVEYEEDFSDWVSFSDIERLTVTLIGAASINQKKGVVCVSYRPG